MWSQVPSRSTLTLFVLAFGASAFTGQDTSTAVAVVGARVYTSPDEPVLADATVVAARGEVVAVGPRESVGVPAGARIIDGTGGTLAAGFWNSHVHFTAPQWTDAASLPPDRVSQQLVEMLTRYGYTTVFDTGSYLENTAALRLRVESGELSGPRILTAGEPFVAKGGTPYYLAPIQLPELLTTAQAREAVRHHLAAGADAIKLHAGAIVDNARDVRVAIPLELVRAVVMEAHRQGRAVLAHPQDLDGLSVSVDGGVDVLLHVTELMERWPADMLARAVERKMALVPTLKLLAGMQATAKQSHLLQQVQDYAAAGGDILFGTDVGFVADYDPEEEYVLLHKAGMSVLDILRSLTVTPAMRFRPSARTGRIAVGYEGDLVLLDGDPEQDVRNFARVRATLRGGQIIFANPALPDTAAAEAAAAHRRGPDVHVARN
jgi:imidazolonepropionase-like amidohydrolase